MDLISRQKAIDALTEYGNGRAVYISVGEAVRRLEQLPSAQPERLTDDDFETIRIHLNAYKENLCNQQRWKEAEEYQRIIDRFMAFATAQPKIVMCKDCKYYVSSGWCEGRGTCVSYDDFCSYAERRTDE